MGLLDVCSVVGFSGTNGTEEIPFIGRGNIWIDNTYDQSPISLARYFILEALLKTAPGQLSILGYDSDLSGIFAPFSALSAGESRQIDLISDKKKFNEQLTFLGQQIQSVQNVIQGREDSLEAFRKSIGRPVEGYKLVVLSMDMGIIENETRALISMLMRRGPAAGVSFLIISTTLMALQTSSGKEIEIKVKSMAPNVSVLEPEDGCFMIEETGHRVYYRAPDARQIISSGEWLMDNYRNAKLPSVPFNELHDLNTFWTRNSIDGLSFAVGKYGIDDMDITIGDEINQRHNVLITGAVGQGKSNLISVIIHSLCMRYSPDELSLYLLDFKEGVTFKPFSDIDQDEYLPHAKALGLESDVSFGLAVMDSLFHEYQKRMKILRQYSVKSIRELRQLLPEMKLPRIVVVIDEFQMMFGDDMQQGMQIADTLEKSVRLFRAAGIHFILASQTLGGNMALAQKKDSIFSQVPVRIALKNSISESQQTLSLNNPAAAFLRPREAIVNLDYGEVTQNRKTVIAYADESVLVPIRRRWWEKARQEHPAPYVFEGEKRITVSHDLDEIVRLRKKNEQPEALLGAMISIDGETVRIPMNDEPGRNIAIIGTPENEVNHATGIMQSIAISLAAQHPRGDARFIFTDFSSDQDYISANPRFNELMEDLGYYIEPVGRAEFTEFVNSLKATETKGERIYLFGANMDRWEYEKDPYGQGTVLKELVENFTSKGIHFIGWWIKASAYTEQIAGFGTSDAFNTKVFLRIDERAIQSLTNPFVKWTVSPNRALICDPVEYTDEIVFIPYAPVIQDDRMAFRNVVWN